MNCEYCKSVFANKVSLNTHQKSAKYCLKIRNETSTISFNCVNCDKTFNNQHHLIRHNTICKQNDKFTELEKKILQVEKERDEMKIILSQKNLLLQDKDKQLKDKDKQIYELQDKLENIAVRAVNRPTTTNNTMTNTNTNNIMNLAPLDMNVLTEKLKTMINENMTEQHLLEGQEGIAKLIAPCFTIEDGRKLITCTDTSRGIWKSKDNNGNILKDVKANNIAKTVQPLAVSKADVLIDLDGKKRTKIYELRDIEKRRKERLDLDEKDEATMKGMKVGSGHHRMYEERIRKRNEERLKDEELEETLLQEFREADELYLINLDDDEKPFKLYAGKEDIKNLKEDSIKFSNSLITLV
jgi:hypothetical protein